LYQNHLSRYVKNQTKERRRLQLLL
jgi:hypothetical protein